MERFNLPGCLFKKHLSNSFRRRCHLRSGVFRNLLNVGIVK